MEIKPCDCPLAGYCKRHNVEKSAAWHKLCQRHQGYRAMWDAGNGPGQHDTQSIGLGDTIEKILGPVGRWYKRLRRGKCGCDKRKAKANKYRRRPGEWLFRRKK
ncbi:hypothetical protein E6Q11_00985 [Candidatus Dojkabacteria bacterium]|uniref:Uncharacterized protein n=1 Tax=Candidatus Dojkabacteria bacterium TaxID=2099670 RepID=A0A5C7JD55_9BACT|nr:MAG: hypothetical protein E6Q11_00985 [Candidatus Dojkabacteria bacterium]